MLSTNSDHLLESQTIGGVLVRISNASVFGLFIQLDALSIAYLCTFLSFLLDSSREETIT